MEDAVLADYGRTLAFLTRLVESALGTLSSTGYRILVLVAQGDERSSQIAGRLAVGRPTISNAVDTLVRQGLLTRTASADDRRAVSLEMTDAGREALAVADAAVAARLRPIFERMEDPDAVIAAMQMLQRAMVRRDPPPT